jgi:hypothetical protein
LRDIAERKATPGTQETKAMIAPGMESQFWSAINKFANFLKHADKDPDEIIEIDEAVNDGILMLAVHVWLDLGHQQTPEMQALWVLFGAIHPELIRSDAPAHFTKFMQNQAWLRTASRHEQMSFGKQLLAMARAA